MDRIAVVIVKFHDPVNHLKQMALFLGEFFGLALLEEVLGEVLLQLVGDVVWAGRATRRSGAGQLRELLRDGGRRRGGYLERVILIGSRRDAGHRNERRPLEGQLGAEAARQRPVRLHRLGKGVLGT